MKQFMKFKIVIQYNFRYIIQPLNVICILIFIYTILKYILTWYIMYLLLIQIMSKANKQLLLLCVTYLIQTNAPINENSNKNSKFLFNDLILWFNLFISPESNSS